MTFVGFIILSYLLKDLELKSPSERFGVADDRVVCVCKEIQIKAQKTYYCTPKLNGLYHLCHIYNNSPYTIALLTLFTLNLFLVSHVTTISTLTIDIQTKLPL